MMTPRAIIWIACTSVLLFAAPGVVAASSTAMPTAGEVVAVSRMDAPRAGVARPGQLYGRQGPSEFSGSQIKRLKKSMKSSGYDPSKPIDIVEVNGRKIIVDGHHRARAAGAAKIKEVPVRIHDVDPATAARLEQEAAQAAHDLGLSHRW